MTRKLIPQQRNANKHTLHGLRLLEKSIQSDGFIDAQTAAADGEIISGSARLELSAEKFADVEPIIVESDGSRPVVVVRTDIPTANDPRAKRLSVAANQIAKTDFNPDGELLAEWGGEDEAIRAMFADSEWQEITGEEKPTKDAEPQTDRAAELLEKWGVQPGDLWQIGEHRLICGDCTDAATVARVMGGENIDAVLADPPYGVSVVEKSTRMKDLGWKQYVNDGDIDTAVSAFNFYHSYDVPLLFWGANHYANKLPNSAGWVVWDKQDGKDSTTYSMCELAWTNAIKNVQYFKHVWDGFRKDTEKGESRYHPSQKPVALYVWFIEKFLQSSVVFIDPFSGSGTTLIACENLRRRCRAIEISPEYVAVALERMATAFPALEIKRLE
jgi:DNA modification methylase